MTKIFPAFLRGTCRSAIRTAHSRGYSCSILPGVARCPRKNAVLDRFSKFAQGQWLDLMTQSVAASAAAMEMRSRRRRTRTDCEISAARCSLEASVAPGIEAICRALTDLRDAIPDVIWSEPFAEPEDCTCTEGQQSKIPDEIVSALRVGQLIVFEKPNGGVRGVVVWSRKPCLSSSWFAKPHLPPPPATTTHCNRTQSKNLAFLNHNQETIATAVISATTPADRHPCNC